MAKARRQEPKIPLVPTDQEVERALRKLPIFEPHDVGSLIAEAKTNNEVDVDTAFLLAFRRRNNAQMNKLLRSLGVDPSRPDAWERGFFHFSVLHHGVGHLAWYVRRTNRNAATWTPAHDLALLREVFLLRRQGLSERAAVKELASDAKKRQLFPYRKQGPFKKAEEPRKREAALWARLQKLKASVRGKSILDFLLGINEGGLSSVERGLYQLATST